MEQLCKSCSQSGHIASNKNCPQYHLKAKKPSINRSVAEILENIGNSDNDGEDNDSDPNSEIRDILIEPDDEENDFDPFSNWNNGSIES